MKRNLCSLLFLYAAFISACREKPASENPVRVTETKEKIADRDSKVFLRSIENEGRIIAFFYNEDNQLASFKLYHAGSDGSEDDTLYATIRYENGRPVECLSRYIEKGQKKSDQILLTYDVDGNIVETWNKEQNSRIYFTNDVQGRMISYRSGKDYFAAWRYDKNGNVIKRDSSAPVPTANGEIKADQHISIAVKYDEHPNPFYYHSLGHTLISLGLPEGTIYQYLSRNNPVEIIESKTYITRKPLPNYRSSGTKTTTSYSHSFDRNGLLTGIKEEEKIQYLTNEQPDVYQKDIIKRKPTIIYHCEKKK